MVKQKILIAGPCSVENREQVLETAKEIAAVNPQTIFRGGIWKPRTKPGMFEGVGEKGLEWLLEVKHTYHLSIATEVANPTHVEKVLAKGINIVWIGARTTVNPFYVQEIAEALKGADVRVFIKNPTHPEIALWEGAVERIAKAGIKEIGLIHRGFKTSANKPYRNDPLWQLAIDMKLRHLDKPLICDISHICGNTVNLFEIARYAALLNYEGLLIETHINPSQALTDAQQQVNPQELKHLWNSIQWRQSEANADLMALNNLRNQVNLIDEELLQLLGNRMKLAEEIGRLKQKGNISVLQAAYFKEILEQRLKEGQNLGLSEDFIKLLFTSIHFESIKKQNTFK